VIEGVKLEAGEYGMRAVLTGAWRDELTKQLLEKGIAELELNLGKGWRGRDLSFLSAFPDLLSLIILDQTIPTDEAIHSLHELRQLTVTTYCDNELRFAEFPKLKRCSLEWRRKARSLFDCTTLTSLFVNSYTGKDVRPFTSLVNLESLAILNAPVENLNGLGSLKALRSLRLGNLKRLTSFAGIEGLRKSRRIGSGYLREHPGR